MWISHGSNGSLHPLLPLLTMLMVVCLTLKTWAGSSLCLNVSTPTSIWSLAYGDGCHYPSQPQSFFNSSEICCLVSLSSEEKLHKQWVKVPGWKRSSQSSEDGVIAYLWGWGYCLALVLAGWKLSFPWDRAGQSGNALGGMKQLISQWHYFQEHSMSSSICYLNHFHCVLEPSPIHLETVWATCHSEFFSCAQTVLEKKKKS